ncbi:MAG: GspE/PulE family protein [bacterium]
MEIDKDKLKSALIKGKYATQKDIDEAEKEGLEQKRSFADVLLNKGLLTNDILGQALAESIGLPYADLNSRPPSKESVQRISEAFARKHRAVLFAETDKNVVIATDKPDELKNASSLEDAFKGKNIEIAFALSDDIDKSFSHYRENLTTRFAEILKKKSSAAPEIIEEILKDAEALRTSDIHLEPQEEDVQIRFRIDGLLQEAGRVPKDLFENILNWIKVRSHLRIDEHFSAQDGSMRFESDGTTVDLRISIVPTLDGEKVAIRILAKYVKGFTLSELGFSQQDQVLVTKASKKPFGMILVTGPTGSGKTTTLYSVLKMLNVPGVNITTIEDPVEYKVKNLNQIQVNETTKLTFARGLRTIVRQDPDIILVGEIRDNETAEIAVNAALTGHLLLSTFHANDAATALPRLLDMGIEPFLLASTLEIVIAQRLARKLCENCRYSKSYTMEELKKLISDPIKYFGNVKSVTLYEGKGCPACSNTGYSGRTAIFELIQMTPEVQELILASSSSQNIWKLASKQGARSLFDNGMEKVKAGLTSIGEVLRVVTPPENIKVYAPTNGNTPEPETK